MDEIDAADFISYSTLRALPYINEAPIVLYTLQSIDGCAG